MTGRFTTFACAALCAATLASTVTPAGEFRAWNVRLTVVDDKSHQVVGRNVAIWISDDARRLPVRLQADLPVGVHGCRDARPAHRVHEQRFAETVRSAFDLVDLGVGERGLRTNRPGDVPAVDQHVPDVELLEGVADRGWAEVTIECGRGYGVVRDRRHDAHHVVAPRGHRIGVDVRCAAQVDVVPGEELSLRFDQVPEDVVGRPTVTG